MARLLFFKLDMLFAAAATPEATGKGRRAKVELDWLFARVSPVPKHDRRSSSATTGEGGKGTAVYRPAKADD